MEAYKCDRCGLLYEGVGNNEVSTTVAMADSGDLGTPWANTLAVDEMDRLTGPITLKFKILPAGKEEKAELCDPCVRKVLKQFIQTVKALAASV